jgi:hypothetical protein
MACQLAHAGCNEITLVRTKRRPRAHTRSSIRLLSRPPSAGTLARVDTTGWQPHPPATSPATSAARNLNGPKPKRPATETANRPQPLGERLPHRSRKIPAPRRHSQRRRASATSSYSPDRFGPASHTGDCCVGSVLTDPSTIGQDGSSVFELGTYRSNPWNPRPAVGGVASLRLGNPRSRV